MGALASNRKRGGECLPLNSRSPGLLNALDVDHVSKKQKLSPALPQNFDQPTHSGLTISRFFRYPEPKSQFGREVHAPCRQNRFGLLRNSKKVATEDSYKVSSADQMGNTTSSKLKRLNEKLQSSRDNAFGTCRTIRLDSEAEGDAPVLRYAGRSQADGYLKLQKDKEAIIADNEASKEDISADSSIEEVEILEDGRGGSIAFESKWRGSDSVDYMGRKNVREGVEKSFHPPSSSLVTNMNDGDLNVDSKGKLLDTSPWSGKLPYDFYLESAKKRDGKLQDLSLQIQLKEKLRETLQLSRPRKRVENLKKDVVSEAFTPLTEEEEAEISHAFSNSKRLKVLVSHKNSNIDITGELLQCLRPGAWLNDEVINLYLELLKEREKREPKKFLKCHFFNTFFYKKLISGRDAYNFQSVRRWTSQRKLGYCLLDCDKIFVPVHKEVHWCLAIINKKDLKFQYLDSLGGFDTRVTTVLERYFVDEVKDKTGKDIDVSSWSHELVEDLPEQENGYDCGVFMIKYADFYSRGVGLCFSQEHMPYFRKRTAKEILRLKAE